MWESEHGRPCSNSAVTVTAVGEEICGSSTVVDMTITKTYKHAKKCV